MTKRLKLKKQVWIFLVITIFVSIGIYSGKNIYQKYQYEKTYEYKLINHGYTLEETKKIIEEFPTNEELEYFLSIEKDSTILDLLEEKYFLKKNFQSYLTYKNSNQNKSLSEIIRDINIHLDKDFYEITYKTDTNQDYKMLVNKYYTLPNDYEPDDLVKVPTKYAWGEAGSRSVRKVAYEAFLDMWESASQDGYYLMINSAYRSYQDQETIYNNYKNKRGEKYADSIAARPGSSEHQTGLSIDIFSKTNSNQKTFHETEEAAWLKENAYKYGFILRYPDNKESITGYSFEAWHYRYVGIEAATYCYQNNITYEEYYAYFIE